MEVFAQNVKEQLVRDIRLNKRYFKRRVPIGIHFFRQEVSHADNLKKQRKQPNRFLEKQFIQI